MKVEIKISKDYEEDLAIIKTSKLTPEIEDAIDYLKNITKSDVIAVRKNDHITVLNPDEIYMIKSKNKKIKVYTENKEYDINKRLYELENSLDDDFIRISKSTIVNIRKIDYIAPSLKGMMFIALKNGLKDNISRNYLREFKNKIGMS